MESFQDDASMFSLSKGPPGGGTFVRRGKNHDNSTIRPTNRANTLKSQTSAATHDGRANSKSVMFLKVLQFRVPKMKALSKRS